MTPGEQIGGLLARGGPGVESERLILGTTEHLWALADEQNMSLSELARRTGLRRRQLRRLLNGDKELTLRMLSRVGHALGHRMTVTSEPVTVAFSGRICDQGGHGRDGSGSTT